MEEVVPWLPFTPVISKLESMEILDLLVEEQLLFQHCFRGFYLLSSQLSDIFHAHPYSVIGHCGAILAPGYLCWGAFTMASCQGVEPLAEDLPHRTFAIIKKPRPAGFSKVYRKRFSQESHPFLPKAGGKNDKLDAVH